jgi:hypothetical protein
MKIRNGFVSNSSTSSFVIGKNYMTEEQIEDFRKKLNFWTSLKDESMYETYIGETPLYFQGELSMHNTVVQEWLKQNNLSKYASTYC